MLDNICVLCGGEMQNEATCRCSVCGSVYIGPPDLVFYDEANAVQHVQEFKSETGFRLNTLRASMLMAVIRPGASVVDIGSSVGGFLEIGRRWFNMAGVEINAHARAMSTEIARGIDVFETLDAFRAQSAGADAATMFDVLEHVTRPDDFLKDVAKSLIPGGALVITTPNASSPGFQSEGKKWRHYKPGEHCWIFSVLGLQSLLTKCGFQVVDINFLESTIRSRGGPQSIVAVVARKVA